MKKRSLRGTGAGVALIGAGALVLVGSVTALAGGNDAPSAPPSPAATSATTDPLAKDIARQQAIVARVPGNDDAWAGLALDYVQQAKVTVDPSYYPKSEAAIAHAFAIDSTGNASAYAAQAALRAALHDFTGARASALRGLRIDAYNATLYGALADAATQLGRYDEAWSAVTKLNKLSPGVPASTRVSYAYELRGDIPSARGALESALRQASAPSDVAFVRFYLGELAFNQGDPAGALKEYTTALRADPRYFAAQQGKAKAEAALGRTDAAVRDYTAAVSAVPQPEYVVEFGDYLTSLGRDAEAKQQYDVFAAENQLFASNGVALDTDPTLFYADHGDAARALQYGKAGIAIRPFVEMDDAYAWALHAAGRDAEAAQWSAKALHLGTRNALFEFHAGMIQKSLGHDAGAKAHLRRALAINPHFSPVHAPEARTALEQL